MTASCAPVDDRSWCTDHEDRVYTEGGTCPGGYREIIHVSTRYELPLTSPREVTRGDDLPRRQHCEARVAVSGYDGGLVGEPLVPDVDVVVLDLPDDVCSLTGREAERLGAALIRAGRQLRLPAGGDR